MNNIGPVLSKDPLNIEELALSLPVLKKNFKVNII